MLRSLVLLVFAIAPGLPLAAADLFEVHLRSGQVARGELVSQDDDKIVVQSSSTSKSGKTMTITLTYKRADIASLVKLDDPLETYRVRTAAATTAGDHAKLAAWCTDMGMGAQALEQAERAVDLDPGQEACVKLALDAGWVRSDGTWVKEADLLAAGGKVRYQGKIMTIAEADELKAAAKKHAAAADAQRTAEEKGSEMAALDRPEAELKKRSQVVEYELAKARNELTFAEAAPQRLAAAKAAADFAQASLDQAKAAPPASAAANLAGYLYPFNQRVISLQMAVTTATKNITTAEADLPKLRGTVSSLENEKSGLDRRLKELSTKRETAQKALDQSKIDAAKATDTAAKPDDHAAKAPASAPGPAPDEKASAAVASADRPEAELRKRSVALDFELTKAKAEVASAEAAPQKFTAAKAAADFAQASLDQAKASPPDSAAANMAAYLYPFNQHAISMQMALATATKATAAAEADLPRLRGKVSALEDEKSDLERRLNALSAKREADQKALDQATSDAAKAAASPATSAGAAPPAAKP
jgi:chromosome segregation ATPase